MNPEVEKLVESLRLTDDDIKGGAKMKAEIAKVICVVCEHYIEASSECEKGWYEKKPCPFILERVNQIIANFKALVEKLKAENPFCDGSRPTNEKGVGGRTWDEVCDTILKAIEEGK